jgi:hypothetical protein
MKNPRTTNVTFWNTLLMWRKKLTKLYTDIGSVSSKSDAGESDLSEEAEKLKISKEEKHEELKFGGTRLFQEGMLVKLSENHQG